jgi:hypothetical protein
MTYLIIQARPEAVIDISTPTLVHDQPPKPTLEPLDTIVNRDTGTPRLITRIRTVTRTSLLLPLRSLLLMLLDLRIQALHDALQAPQPLHELPILRLPALPGCAPGAGEHAFDLRAGAIGARLLLVALYLAPPAGDAGARI